MNTEMDKREEEIYFDNASTTKVDETVIESMQPYFDKKYGNASSIHLKGKESRNALEKSKEIIAKTINSDKDEIHFTSGGSESNNLALKGLFFSNYPKKNHIITTKIEHDCILSTCKWLEAQGAKITYLNVDKEGFINIEELKKAITKKTFLVSVIHGNNEIGTIQDIEKIGEICKEKGILFHTDACQSFTKVPIDVKKQNINLMTLNAHKIHGPKGIGAIYINKKSNKIDNEISSKITPLIHGGGQEKNIRSGTENIPGIVGFAKAIQIVKNEDIEKMKELRDKIIEGSTRIKGVKLNGPLEKRLCNNISLLLNNIDGEVLGGYLENNGIFVSVGSACMAHSEDPSHVLLAIGVPKEKASNSIRISISKYTQEKEVDFFLKKFKEIIKKFE